MKTIKEYIKTEANKIGFDLVGFTGIKIPSKNLKTFKDWLNKNFEGNMSYMKKIQKRADIQKILPGAKTVISLATNYYYEQKPLSEGAGRVARYAYGRDYHKIISKRLKKLEKVLKELDPYTKTKSYVDTGPFLERAFAEEAGIGVIGKNTCLITKEFGSWVFLSEIITTLEIEPDKFIKSDKNFSACGGCKKCIEACPTGAIIKPGVIDARLCLSYLTIEHKEKIPKKVQKIIKKTKRIYGCDICQEVCPHNIKNAKSTAHKEFLNPKIAGNELPFKEILSIKTDAQFLNHFAGSPLMRAKRKGLQKNLKFFKLTPQNKKQI